MSYINRKLPVLTGDVSGAASALYELGGMTVIHDPSGCNSTYNTHDEIRWYEEESLIFISGLNDMDAILGRDEKLINDTLEAAENLKPDFIAFTNSPIPYLNGTDFKGIAKEVEKKSGIPAFYVNSNGAHDYTAGVSDAFLNLAIKFCDGKRYAKTDKIRVNILGATPLDFANRNTMESLVKMLEAEGFDINCNLAFREPCLKGNLGKLSDCDVNLVISSTGSKCAEYMREKFNIPFVAGLPTGKFADKVFAEIRTLSGNKLFSKPEENCRNFILGEGLSSLSVAENIKLETGIDFNVVNVTETKVEGTINAVSEDDLRGVLKDAKIVIGDPLYKIVAPETTEFIPLPHLAMSGRLYLKNIPDLTDLGGIL